MTQIVSLLFGPSWKSSLIGYVLALVAASINYAQAQPSPGWYLLAIGFAALGRVVKDADKSNAPLPIPTSQSVK